MACRLALAGTDDAGKKLHPGMFDDGVISLAHGDGTRRPPVEALTAGVRALLDAGTCPLDDYLFLQTYRPLQERLEADYRTLGVHTCDNILIECGTARLFGAFLHEVAAPGDVFLAARSFYHGLPDWCAAFGVHLACVPTEGDSNYKLTPAALEATIASCSPSATRPGPRGIVLFNPTQTGAIYSEAELVAIAQVVLSRDLVVLEDRIFVGTEFNGVPLAPSLASVAPELAQRTVTLGGVSKSHNLANLRVGWACGPEQIIEAMRRYSLATIIAVPRLTQIMALAALSAPSDHLFQNALECRHRVECVRRALSAFNDQNGTPGAYRLLHEPLAGHSILVSMEPLRGRPWRLGVIENSVDVARYLLSEAGVAVSPAFSSGFDGCEVRLCLGSIGLAQTYAGAADVERRAVLATLNVDEAGGSDEGTASSADVFSAGRQRLEMALYNRLAPVLRAS